MPRIAINGFRSLESAEADKLRQRINVAVQSIGLGDDAAAQIIPSDVRSCDGRDTSMPFIQLFSNKPAEIRAVLTVLKEIHIGYDVEWSLIGGFIPASDLR